MAVKKQTIQSSDKAPTHSENHRIAVVYQDDDDFGIALSALHDYYGHTMMDSDLLKYALHVYKTDLEQNKLISF